MKTGSRKRSCRVSPRRKFTLRGWLTHFFSSSLPAGLFGQYKYRRGHQRRTSETLEPRLMLSADLLFTMTAANPNVTVLFDNPSSKIRIVDSGTSAILVQQDRKSVV